MKSTGTSTAVGAPSTSVGSGLANAFDKKFLLLAAGIFVSYFYFGILQEKITRGDYEFNGQKEKFTSTLTLVAFQCVFNYLVALIALKFWKQQREDTTRTTYYASAAFTYLLAMICSNMSLRWVPYPTQVIGKSAKPIPVMILGVLIGRKHYPLRKYFFIFLIVVGIVLFMYKDSAAASSKAASTENASILGIGEILLLLSLTMDGLTGAVQERIRAESKPTGLQMMEKTNLWSTGYLIVAILVTGEIFSFLSFANRYPTVIFNLFAVGLTSAVGQLFLYSMVSEYGPLLLSVVTTTRKFFTVLASVIFFGNVLIPRQWFGTFVVFLGLFLNSYYGKPPAQKHHAKYHHPPKN